MTQERIAEECFSNLADEPKLNWDEGNALKQRLNAKQLELQEALLEEVRQRRNEIAASLHENLDEHKVVVFPWGWIPKAGAGHAMLVECQKDNGDVLIRVFNTGGGTEFHETDRSGDKVFVNTIRTYQISRTNLQETELFAAMLEPKIISGLDLVMEQNQDYSACDLYLLLERDSEHSSTQTHSRECDASNWMKAQLSGTCSLRCLMAYLSLNIGIEYKLLKSLWHLEVVETLLDDQSISTNPDMLALLAKAIPNLFRQQQKLINQIPDLNYVIRDELNPKLIALEKISNKKLKSDRNTPVWFTDEPAFVEHSPDFCDSLIFDEAKFKSESIFDFSSFDVQSKVSESANLKETQSEKEHMPSEAVFPSWGLLIDDFSITNLINYCDTFNSAMIHYQKAGNHVEDLLHDFFRRLGRLAIDADIKNYSEELSRLEIDQGETLLNHLVNSTGILFNHCIFASHHFDLRILISMPSALAFAWEIARHMDNAREFTENQRFDFYGIACSGLFKFEQCKIGYYPFLNRKWEGDYQHIATYFRTQTGANSLFNFANQEKKDKSDPFADMFGPPSSSNQKSKKLHLPQEDGDYGYIATHSSVEHDWSDIDKEFRDQESKQENSSSSATAEEWHCCWLYVNEPPNATFIQLRQLAWMAKLTATPFKEMATNRNIPPFTALKLSNLRLSEGAICFDFPCSERLVESIDWPGNESGYFFSPGNTEKGYYDRFENALLRMGFSKSSDEHTLQTTIDLNPSDQNSVVAFHVASLHEILSAKTVEHGLQFTILIDAYRKNIDAFAEKDLQIFFPHILFYPLRLGRALYTYPNLANHLCEFFTETIQYYEKKIETAPTESDVEALLFILEQEQRCLCWFVNHDGSGIAAIGEKGLPACRIRLNELLENPIFKGAPYQEHLLLSLLDSYQGAEGIEGHAIREILFVRARLQFLNTTGTKRSDISPGFRRSAFNVLTENREAIEGYIKTQLPDLAFLNDILTWTSHNQTGMI